MAWVNTYPTGAAEISGGISPGWVDFYTYRTMRGPVQMRLTDVTFDDGYQFSSFDTNMQLVDGGGYVYKTFTLHKTWGVLPGWTTLAAYQNYVTLRIRITSSNDVPRNAGGTWFQFRAHLRWDPVLV